MLSWKRTKIKSIKINKLTPVWWHYTECIKINILYHLIYATAVVHTVKHNEVQYLELIRFTQCELLKAAQPKKWVPRWCAHTTQELGPPNSPDVRGRKKGRGERESSEGVRGLTYVCIYALSHSSPEQHPHFNAWEDPCLCFQWTVFIYKYSVSQYLSPPGNILLLVQNQCVITTGNRLK